LFRHSRLPMPSNPIQWASSSRFHLIRLRP
jgi:hypothetical protein